MGSGGCVETGKECRMEKPWEIPEPDDVLEVPAADGSVIHVRRHGIPHGPRLLLTHGNGMAADAYFPFWGGLTDRFEIFVHDLRNHGWNRVGCLEHHRIANLIDDGGRVVEAIEREFSRKPLVGLFHSLSGLLGLRQSIAGVIRFDAIVAFDLPVVPPGQSRDDIERVGKHLARMARKRRNGYPSYESFVRRLARMPVFNRLQARDLDLIARTTLKARPEGGVELRCPPEYEAQMFEEYYSWSSRTEARDAPCPVKAISADPTITGTYLPGEGMEELVHVDYDFVPETSHLHQIEAPNRCRRAMLEFLDEIGFQG